MSKTVRQPFAPMNASDAPAIRNTFVQMAMTSAVDIPTLATVAYSFASAAMAHSAARMPAPKRATPADSRPTGIASDSFIVEKNLLFRFHQGIACHDRTAAVFARTL